jgi:hypothetical protein
MKKVLITGLGVLFVFAVLSVVVAGAPGMSGDPDNGTTEEEGLATGTSSGNSGEETPDASSGGDDTDSASEDEGLLDKIIKAVENYIRSEIEFYKRLWRHGIHCVLRR